MSEYKRFVSYIYAYDRGIKSKNVGFAKMEVRNGECRISISIKGAFSASERELNAYFFYRQEENMIGIRMGCFPVKNGMGDFYSVTDAGNICGSHRALEEMSGIVLCHGDETMRMYASGWDDHAMMLEFFIPSEKRMQMELMQEEQAEIECAAAIEAAEVTEIDMAETSIPVMEAVEEELARLSASIHEAQSGLEAMLPVSQPEIREKEPEVHNKLWNRLETMFPKIVAFEDDSDVPCLKIDLKDLEYLPRENWGLANNSFLLHGYYNFRYLILAELGENQYMIGVPGMFHNNERFMAAMFGFEYFKPVKEYKPLTGHFGYWYQWVVM